MPCMADCMIRTPAKSSLGKSANWHYRTVQRVEKDVLRCTVAFFLLQACTQAAPCTPAILHPPAAPHLPRFPPRGRGQGHMPTAPPATLRRSPPRRLPAPPRLMARSSSGRPGQPHDLHLLSPYIDCEMADNRPWSKILILTSLMPTFAVCAVMQCHQTRLRTATLFPHWLCSLTHY